MLNGPGRFGLHRRTVNEARDELRQWANNWRPVVPHIPTDPTQLAYLAAGSDTHQIHDAVHAYARAAADHAHPEHQAAIETAKATAEQAQQARATYRQAVENFDDQLARYGSLAYAPDPEARLARTEQEATALTVQADDARRQITTLLREPTLRSLPPDRIQTERDTWLHDRSTQHAAARRAAQAAARAVQIEPGRIHRPEPGYTPPRAPQHRRGPSR